MSLSDKVPGADLIESERTISVPVAAVGLTTAALAEALKVAHINLDDREAVAGLSLLSPLGMITADAHAFRVPTPRPLLLRIARYLDGAAASITDGANLPDGLDDTHRQHFADILAQDADAAPVTITALENLHQRTVGELLLPHGEHSGPSERLRYRSEYRSAELRSEHRQLFMRIRSHERPVISATKIQPFAETHWRA